MYKKLVFEKFFNDEYQASLGTEERKIAASLLTPHQIVHAMPNTDLKLNHLDLSLGIIADMYKVIKPTFNGDIEHYRHRLLVDLNKVIKNDELNFVLIRYILLRNNRIAVVEAPYFITEYERDMLLELDKLFEELNIDTDVLIHKYDPINMETMFGSPEGFSHEDNNAAIKKAIKYYEGYHSIVNYELNAPKEYILKNQT